MKLTSMTVTTDTLPTLPEGTPLEAPFLSPSLTAAALAAAHGSISDEAERNGNALRSHVASLAAFAREVCHLDSSWGPQ